MPKSATQTKPTRKPPAETDTQAERDGVNVVVVRGTVSSPPDVRVLPSEAVLAQLQVSTRLESETLSTPVAVWSPAAWVESLEPGDEVVVVGRVRRRFFRAGGAAASRVEVEADVVARARDRRRVHAAVQRAVTALEVLDE
jgi:single-strand DNA-binding protein